MATEFQAIKLRQLPGTADVSPKQLFWRDVEVACSFRFPSSVFSVDFCCSENLAILAASGMKVAQYSGIDYSPLKSVTSFRDIVYSAKFRSDGQLFACGSKDGSVRVFDSKSRVSLRTMSGHNSSVRAVCWSQSKISISSGCDDGKCFRWDLSTGDMISSFNSHSDCVKHMFHESISGSEVLVTSGYDHSLKLWNLTDNSCIHSIQHSHPVECACYSPLSGNHLYSASGCEVLVWDIRNLHYPIRTFSDHAKTVTSIDIATIAMDSISPQKLQLFAAGLEGKVRIYDLNDDDDVHTISPSRMSQGATNEPILSMKCISVNSNKFLIGVGSAQGNFSIFERLDYSDTSSSLSSSSITYGMLRERNNNPIHRDAEVRVDRVPRRRLEAYEKFLVSFQYHKALMAALVGSGEGLDRKRKKKSDDDDDDGVDEPASGGKDPLVVIGVLEELDKRNGLQIAITSSFELLESLLSFINVFVCHPCYCFARPLLTRVMLLIADRFENIIRESEVLEDLVHSIIEKIKVEVEQERVEFQLKAAIDSLTHEII